jgi:hypothetical protein
MMTRSNLPHLLMEEDLYMFSSASRRHNSPNRHSKATNLHLQLECKLAYYNFEMMTRSNLPHLLMEEDLYMFSSASRRHNSPNRHSKATNLHLQETGSHKCLDPDSKHPVEDQPPYNNYMSTNSFLDYSEVD